jgi:hypothetical protein
MPADRTGIASSGLPRHRGRNADFTLRWRTLDNPAVFQRLQEQRINPDFHGASQRGDQGKQVYFKVEAEDGASALEKGHEILRAAGADKVRPQDLEIA